MAFNHIEYKKPIYKIKAPLRDHLEEYSRIADISLSYDDLLRYQQLIPITDNNGKDTNWFSALYPIAEQKYFQEELVNIYQTLVADGDILNFVNQIFCRMRMLYHQINYNYNNISIFLLKIW